MMRQLLAVLLLSLLGVALPAQVLSTILPRGAQRGTEIDIVFVGSSLQDPVTVLMSDPGIELLSIKGLKSTRVSARIRVAKDCPLGSHTMWLVTKQGMTRAKTLQIGTMPEVAELATPNGDLDHAQPIDLDVTIGGSARGADVDWYRFECAQGQELTFEVEAVRMGQGGFDAFLELRDHEGEVLGEMDDCILGRLDPVLTHTFAEEGVYYIVIRDSGYRGGSDSYYRLHVGSFPRPRGTIPCGGPKDKPLGLQWLGAAGEEQITISKSSRVYHDYFATRDGKTAPTPNLVRVSGLPVHLSPLKKGVVLPVPFAIDGTIESDKGWVRHRFKAKKGDDLDVVGITRRLRSPVDLMLVVRDLLGKRIVSNDDRVGTDSVLRFKVPKTGDYYLDVYDVLRRHGPEMFFRVEVRKRTSGMTTKIAVSGLRAEDYGLKVPRGGRTATMIAASNLDRAAGVQLGLVGLPEGVTVTVPRFRKGADLVPVLVEADAKAPLGGGLAEMVATRKKKPVKLGANFSHYLPAVRVENNIIYGGRMMWRIPVAVTDPCPFDVEVVQPKVPIIRGASLGMKVKITRSKGFKGTVYTKLLWNPPGITSGTITIAGSKSEGRFNLNARSSASIQTWKITLVAWTKVGAVTRRINSKLIDLEVSPPWIEASIGKVRGEQGQKLALEVSFTKKRDFAGEFKAELLRLPKGIATEFPMINASTEKVVFDIAVAAKAPPGRHRGHYLRLLVPSPGGPVMHYFRGGEVRIDKPLPARLKKAPKKKAKAVGVQGGDER